MTDEVTRRALLKTGACGAIGGMLVTDAIEAGTEDSKRKPPNLTPFLA